MSNSPKEKGIVTLYGAGGTGVNLVKAYEARRDQDTPGNAIVKPYYIDTSRSNMDASISDSHAYLVDGTDGSGKFRRENAEEIGKRAKEILGRFKPGNLSIIVSSGSGGSGSVIAPNLARELLDADQTVVVVMVGDATTRLDAQNTLNTLKSYDAIVSRTEKALAVLYVQNGPKNPRKDVDTHVRAVIDSLIVFASRENEELDTKDIANLFRFDRGITTYGPQLAALTLVDAKTDLDQLGNIIAVGTLAKRDEDTQPPGTPDAQYVGYLPADSSPVKNAQGPLHFVLSDGIFSIVSDNLSGFLKDLDKKRSGQSERTRLVSDKDTVTDGGLVL